jgi:hypothetical protein
MQNRYSCVLHMRYKQLKKNSIIYQPDAVNIGRLQVPRSKGITANRLSYLHDKLYNSAVCNKQKAKFTRPFWISQCSWRPVRSDNMLYCCRLD